MERILNLVLINSNHLVRICVIRQKYYKYFFSTLTLGIRSIRLIRC